MHGAARMDKPSDVGGHPGAARVAEGDDLSNLTE
jgi:hypothetical protein